MLDRRYHNARADDCSVLRPGAGSVTVTYRGAGYVVIGVYFMARSGRHEICYVLRPTLLDELDEGRTPAQSSGSGQPGFPTSTEGRERRSPRVGAT